MAQLHERETQALQPTGPIEPAQGNEKERLEAACKKYLQNPDQTSVDDFVNFTQNMIALLGGERHTLPNSRVKLTWSNPLLDPEKQTSIIFRVVSGALTPTTVKIDTTSADHQEILEANISFDPAEPPLYSRSTKLNRPLEIDSYITGKREIIPLGISPVEPDAVKGFARKVFDVYRRQGQDTTQAPV